ncbi:MAG: argininosuccinate synthase [Solirubrobacteraceae bacterium]
MSEHSQPSEARTASYEADPAQVHRVLLLYSGGLDTSVMLKWIQDKYDAEVVCLTVNLGQPGEDYGVIEGKAMQLGALECHIVDARAEFAAEYLTPAIRANALYGGGYPLFTALGRPLIAKLAVEHARASGCDTIAHGCTGKGNDQVRIEATIATLAPELRVIAPVRSWAMGREEEIAYAREHGIPVKGGTEAAPYSIDDNLWGRSSEGRWIEDLGHAPDDDVFQLVTRPEEAPDEAQEIEIGFERGIPVSLDGRRMELVELIEAVADIAARHGVGIIDHIEDRIVGLKVRDIYEAPAAAILLPAHQDLERLVCTIHQNQFKPELDRQWAFLVYAGLWWEPLREDLDAYMERVNVRVTGTIGMKLYKGHARVTTRSSPNAVYDASLASFAQSGGLFSQTASPGFIELWSLQSRMAWRLPADMSVGLSSGRVESRRRGPACAVWWLGRGAGLGVGVASLMMRGLGTPGPVFVLPACAV